LDSPQKKKPISSEAVSVGDMGGQIKVAPGESLPDEVLRDIEKQKTNNVTIPNANTSVPNSNTPVPTTNAQIPNANTSIPTTNTQNPPIQKPATRVSIPPAQKEVATNSAEQVATTKPNYQANVGETLVKVAVPKNRTPSTNQPVDTSPTKQNPVKATALPKEDTRPGESVVRRPIKKGKTRDMARDFTGYQIEFLLTDQPLSATNPMFYQHGNIILERKPSGEFAYLLGDFKEKRDASVFLREVILPRYATAKLVYYIKGKRVGYVHGKDINNAGMPPR